MGPPRPRYTTQRPRVPDRRRYFFFSSVVAFFSPVVAGGMVTGPAAAPGATMTGGAPYIGIPYGAPVMTAPVHPVLMTGAAPQHDGAYDPVQP